MQWLDSEARSRPSGEPFDRTIGRTTTPSMQSIEWGPSQRDDSFDRGLLSLASRWCCLRCVCRRRLRLRTTAPSRRPIEPLSQPAPSSSAGVFVATHPTIQYHRFWSTDRLRTLPNQYRAFGAIDLVNGHGQRPHDTMPSAAATAPAAPADSSSTTTLYEMLGVPPEASLADIRQAYLRAARQHHPDRQTGQPKVGVREGRLNEITVVLGPVCAMLDCALPCKAQVSSFTGFPTPYSMDSSGQRPPWSLKMLLDRHCSS